MDGNAKAARQRKRESSLRARAVHVYAGVVMLKV